jgi:hypothetical protein
MGVVIEIWVKYLGDRPLFYVTDITVPKGPLWCVITRQRARNRGFGFGI